jgi:hypothetical protein
MDGFIEETRLKILYKIILLKILYGRLRIEDFALKI